LLEPELAARSASRDVVGVAVDPDGPSVVWV
jgi:hypothetical protein